MNKAIFLDKDGTLIENVPYNVDPDKIRLYKDVPAALKLFKQKNFLLIVITNQPGLAYGHFQEEDLKKVEAKIADMFSKFNVTLDGFYYCPHHPCGNIEKYAVECNCRKPKPGMVLQAARKFNVDLSKSWLIGDILHDVEAGKIAGCKTILINNGNETEWMVNKSRLPNYVANDMEEASERILEMRGEKMYERAIKKSG
jgi:D-glycero-D-manno-heptose 1,7-bisphosphate phosphatase